MNFAPATFIFDDLLSFIYRHNVLKNGGYLLHWIFSILQSEVSKNSNFNANRLFYQVHLPETSRNFLTNGAKTGAAPRLKIPITGTSVQYLLYGHTTFFNKVYPNSVTLVYVKYETWTNILIRHWTVMMGHWITFCSLVMFRGSLDEFLHLLVWLSKSAIHVRNKSDPTWNLVS